MSRRGVKVVVVTAAAAVLTGVLGATAWAETVTPGVEQPILDMKVPGGLLGGSSVPGTPANGNQSSAEGRNGDSYGRGGDSYYGGDPYYSSGSPFDDTSDNGYWRQDGGGSGDSGDGGDGGGSEGSEGSGDSSDDE